MNFYMATTGHRPPMLGGYDAHDKHDKIRAHMRQVLQAAKDYGLDPVVISGMALGIDQFWAESAIELEIQVIAAMPFPDMGSNWPAESRKKLQELLAKCSDVRYICGSYSQRAFLLRDEWMVDNANLLVAYWNGQRHGGTYHTVCYADKTNTIRLTYNPDEIITP